MEDLRGRKGSGAESYSRELMEAVNKVGSSSLLINIVAKRIKQLYQGARPLIENTEGLTPTEIAVRELSQGKIGFRRSPESESKSGKK